MATFQSLRVASRSIRAASRHLARHRGYKQRPSRVPLQLFPRFGQAFSRNGDPLAGYILAGRPNDCLIALHLPALSVRGYQALESNPLRSVCPVSPAPHPVFLTNVGYITASPWVAMYAISSSEM